MRYRQGSARVNDDAHAAVDQYVHGCAVGLLQDIWSNHLRGRSRGDHIAIDADETWEVSRDAVEVMRCENDGDSVRVEIRQQMEHLVPGANVDTRGGLV